jgi:hypothetical protein
MNGVVKPGDYPLTSLRGRHFARLTTYVVETYNVVACADCNRECKHGSLMLSEPSDERLTREGLKIDEETFKLEPAILLHIHGDFRCPTCYALWLKPWLARRDAHGG